MKKKICFILAGALLAVMVGCSKTQSGTTVQSSAVVEEASEPQSETVVQESVPPDYMKPLTIDECAEANHYSTELIDSFIRSGRNYKKYNYDDKSLLMRVAECGDLASAKRLIAVGVNVNEANTIKADSDYQIEITGKTALMAAAYSGNAELVQALLDAGADVKAKITTKGISKSCFYNGAFLFWKTNYKPTHGYYDSVYFEAFKLVEQNSAESALHYAILGSNSAEVSKRLIAAGALAQIPESTQSSLVELAIALERLDVLKLLVEAGVPITDFHVDVVAASMENVEVYKRVLALKESEKDINVQKRLEQAVRFGRASVVEYLIELNKEAFNANDYLDFAVEGENTETLALLVKRGGDLRKYNEDASKNALSRIAHNTSKPLYEMHEQDFGQEERGESEEAEFPYLQRETGMLKMLTDAGGFTADQYTDALFEQFEIHDFDSTTHDTPTITSHVKLLLELGADPFAQNAVGEYPLNLAINSNDAFSVYYLIDAMLSQPEVLKEILNKKGDYDELYDESDTYAYQYAPSTRKYLESKAFGWQLENNPDLVPKLLNAGIDIYVKITSEDTEDTNNKYAHTDIPKVLATMIARGGLLEKEHNLETLNKYLFEVTLSDTEDTVSAVKRLLAAGANVNYKERFNVDTPLTRAIKFSNENVVRALIEAGADLHGRKDYSAISLAFEEKRYDIARVLIEAKADVNDTLDGASLLVVAIYAGESSLAKTMIEAGADVNSCGIPDIETPNSLRQPKTLIAAARMGNYEIGKALIAAGAIVGPSAYTYYSPLMAVMDQYDSVKQDAQSQIRFAQMLIDAGDDINNGDADGSTALHYAARRSDVSVVEFLIQAGADVNAKTSFGRTPLGTCLSYESFKKDVFRVFVNAGADLTVKDDFGMSMLSYAARSGADEEVIKTLIDGGADVNAVTKKTGETPLHLQDDVEVAKLLIAAGANVNAVDAEGRTPLHVACKNQNYKLVKLLLDSGAEIDVKDKYGNLAKQYVDVEHFEIIKLIYTAKRAGNSELEDDIDEEAEDEDLEKENEEDEEGKDPDCDCGGCADRQKLVCLIRNEHPTLELSGPYYLNPICQNFSGIAGCKY